MDNTLSRAAARRAKYAVGVTGVLALVVSCTAAPTNTQSTSSASKNVRQGGSLVIGQEQDFQCADWLGSCGGDIWGTYVFKAQTIPGVFDLVPKGQEWVEKPSNLVSQEPASRVVDGKQQITYKINPDAVWSDGEPITSADIKYTALQIRDGKDILDKTGYSQIARVATPDEHTALLHMKSPYAQWKLLFSGFDGVLPSHILKGKDRSKAMANGYSWSGGPWKMASWKKGRSLVLEPNPKYWGDKPKLSKVTFQLTTNTSAQFQAFKSGQIDAMAPAPQLDAIEEIKRGIPGSQSKVNPNTGNVEALWMNHEVFPFNDPDLRRAVAYGIDRKALVKRMYGDIGVEEPAQSFWPGTSAGMGEDYFSKYSKDLDKVNEIMTGAGWEKNSSGIWAKGGKTASFELVGAPNDARRLLIEQIVQRQLKTAGFRVKIKNSSKLTSYIFSDPYQMAVLALVATEPQAAFHSKAGLNFTNTDDPKLDRMLTKLNTTLVPDERQQAATRADRKMADDAVSLPLDLTPMILLTKNEIGGPLSINPVRGPFWNLHEWGLVAD